MNKGTILALNLLPQLCRQKFIYPLTRAVEANPMVTVRKRNHLELVRRDALGHQQIRQHRRVLVVNIIIASAVHQGKLPRHVFKALGIPYRRLVVAIRVGRRRLHVPLRVGGIIEPPVRHGRRAQPKGEGARVGLNHLGGEEAAKRPPPDAYLVWMQEFVARDELLRRPNLVLGFQVADVLGHG